MSRGKAAMVKVKENADKMMLAARLLAGHHPPFRPFTCSELRDLYRAGGDCRTLESLYPTLTALVAAGRLRRVATGVYAIVVVEPPKVVLKAEPTRRVGVPDEPSTITPISKERLMGGRAR